MKFKSEHIIIILVAFMVGVAFASISSRDSDPNDTMENEAMEESMEEGEEGEDTEEEAETSAPAAATETSTPAATSKPSNEFVSGNCQTGLSGYKDNKLNAIVLNWSPCASDNFQFYKLVKSSKNTSPNFPADPVAFSSSNKNAANFVDKTVAPRTTYYYRMCVVQRLGAVNCSNVATVSY